MSVKILSVAAVTDNFPDGQKITAAQVKFSGEIHPEHIRVAGKTVTSFRVEGNTVILELEPSTPQAELEGA